MQPGGQCITASCILQLLSYKSKKLESSEINVSAKTRKSRKRQNLLKPYIR